MTKATKTVLGESLKKLLQKKPLNKITVSELVNDCGMNRMTFYYHFQDIYDLLEWICAEDARKALEGMDAKHDWQEGLYNIFRLVLDNKAFVMNSYRSSSRSYLEMYIYRLTDELFAAVIEELDGNQALSQKDRDFMASYYKYAFLGVVLNWVNNNMQDDPKEVLERLRILVEGDPAAAVERLAAL